jgi:epoxyqueuosine reductase
MELLSQWASAKGYRAALGPAEAALEARAEVLQRASCGELEPEFNRQWLAWLEGEPSPEERSARTALVVAIPSTAKTISFDLRDSSIRALVPPTYGEDTRMDEAVRLELEAAFPQLRAGLAVARAPRKALAARLGLALYGRNNITYAPGLGSYILLCAYLTGAIEPPAESVPRAVQSLAECESCGACADACPTGAISADRFLLRAQRCIVRYNELADPWPSWLAPSVHTCLVGCMACQEICPCNAGLLRTIDSGLRFPREETEVMLSDSPDRSSAPWPAIRQKLASLGLEGYEAVIGRNLGALIR